MAEERTAEPKKSGRSRGGRGGRRRHGRKPRRSTKNRGANPEEVARLTFGVQKLHPEQLQAMNALIEGRDTMVILPTGFGKSLIYQVPAMLIDRPTVVISPLIALMRDQERSLQRLGVPVVRLDSTLRAAARRHALGRIRKGGRVIILTTPETLESVDARPALVEARPGLMCVDEAHCVSEWGHDFRPAYLRVGAERRSLEIPTTLALTATATPRVQDDIAERLGLVDPERVVGPPDRENITLDVLQAPGNLKFDALAKALKRLPRPGIVYCATTKAVDEIFEALTRARIPCARYHGKMKTEERNSAQRQYMKVGKRLVMIATTAFGMGIDKRDIRYIVHHQVPGSLEQYVQEFGRAGRDGKQSQCTLLFDPADIDIQKYLQRSSRPRSEQLKRVAFALAAWADEEKPVAAKDLALSAAVPATIARSMCAQLEMVGLIELNEDRKYVSKIPPEELRTSAEDLARRFEIQRREDERRLRAMVDYANTDMCRSVFIRQWFGAEGTQPCGRCDNCQIRV